MDPWYVLILFGLVCGIFSAMFGVGSGIIMVPVLTLLLHFPQKSAQGMSLAVMAPMALVGAIRYRMNPEMDMDMAKALLLAAGGVAGAWLGAYFVGKLSGGLLRRVFAAIMVVADVKMFVSSAGIEREPVGPAASGARAPVCESPAGQANENQDQ